MAEQDSIHEHTSRTDRDLGYLTRAVEDLTALSERNAALVVQHMENEERDRKEIQDRLKKIEDELNMYKVVIRTLKLLGTAAVLILAFKFGDGWKIIKQLFL